MQREVRNHTDTTSGHRCWTSLMERLDTRETPHESRTQHWRPGWAERWKQQWPAYFASPGRFVRNRRACWTRPGLISSLHNSMTYLQWDQNHQQSCLSVTGIKLWKLTVLCHQWLQRRSTHQQNKPYEPLSHLSWVNPQHQTRVHPDR